MLAEHKLKVLLDLIKDSSKEELAWMHGYIAGLLTTGAALLKQCRHKALSIK